MSDSGSLAPRPPFTRLLLLAALVAALAAALLSAAPARAEGVRWTLLRVDDVSSAVYSQGLASDRAGTLHGRGYLTIRPEVAADGWTHIGDGDLHRGRMYDAYEQLSPDASCSPSPNRIPRRRPGPSAGCPGTTTG